MNVTVVLLHKFCNVKRVLKKRKVLERRIRLCATGEGDFVIIPTTTLFQINHLSQLRTGKMFLALLERTLQPVGYIKRAREASIYRLFALGLQITNCTAQN